MIASLPFRGFLLSLASTAIAGAALTENFDSYPGGGTGWSANWSNSTGTSLASPTVANTTPLNGGGSYLSVSTSVDNSETGIRRGIGSIAASPYTVSFDWRYDSNVTNFDNYNDRIHFGANTGSGFGTGDTWSWIIGAVGGNQSGSNTFSSKEWYFYNGSSTTTGDNGFNTGDMRMTGILLTAGVTYSFTVVVDPASQTYRAVMTDGTTTFDSSILNPGGLNFRNQRTTGTDASNNASNLVFGGANTGTGHTLNWSIDNLNIIPEPSSALLAGLSAILCFVRRRIVH